MKVEIKEVKLRDGRKTVQRIFGEDVMTYAHTRLHAYCSPYVPMGSGVLDQFVDIYPDCVHYKSPYAHYQWEGEIYGPNFPIYEDGVFAGWRSPKGESKHPTGRELNYSGDQHPLATSHWEQAMMAAKGDEFCKDIEDYLRRK